MPKTWTNTFLNPKRQLADPLADKVVADLVAQNGQQSARNLFDELTRNVALPLEGKFPEVDAFLQTTGSLPDWTVPEKLELANRFFNDHGPKLLIILYHKSLPTLYLDAHGAKVLVQTGRLAHDGESKNTFARRIAETGQFLLNVMRHNALTENGHGIRAAQKIRLIHASVRNFIPEEHWNTAEWGKPINQEDLALTLMSFSILLLEGLDAFGINYSTQEAEAYIHHWNVIGHFMGIDNDLLPASREEASSLVKAILDRQASSSDAGRLLTDSLITFTESNIPFEKFEKTSTLLIRFLIGNSYASMLGLIPQQGCFAYFIPRIFKRLFSTGERLEDVVNQPMKLFLETFSYVATKKLVGYFDNYKNRHFTIPEEFEKRWFKAP
jgi:hypothetical protein